MNMVVVKHPNDSGKYLFRLPAGVVVDAGTMVAVDTIRGTDQPGVCITSSFEADPAVICPMWGTKHLKKVTKILREFPLTYPENELPFTEPNVEEPDELPY